MQDSHARHYQRKLENRQKVRDQFLEKELKEKIEASERLKSTKLKILLKALLSNNAILETITLQSDFSDNDLSKFELRIKYIVITTPDFEPSSSSSEG